ncbi:putative Transcription factor [Melia azedarach]|uniref:Transcription factor n=1 Tax=Melia azedarach TaxID=155640 RepID=A0ACC1YA31_MELAZ|nr:putative Transcription factor [Melia azedarach]
MSYKIFDSFISFSLSLFFCPKKKKPNKNMADQYGLPDLGHLATGRTHFPANQQASEPYFFHRNLAQSSHNDTIMLSEMVLPGHLVRFGHDNFATTASASASAAAHPAMGTANSAKYALEMDAGWNNIGNEGGNCRWPRQETLTLLEIRSRLDSKFREANQKKPLWDEVSRIMAEEHGYHRSEKKCREKFENLYKYYKKTKEGKAGRQDGKHYRFFRQLEALYGETSNNQNSVSESPLDQNINLPYQTPNNTTNQENLENQEAFQEQKLSTESLSFSNTSEFETASSGNNDDDLSAIAFMMNQKSMEKNKGINESQSGGRVKRSWKAKVKEFVDAQMQKLMESQEAWMERMLKTIEDREQERLSKEEEWRKQEVARFDRVHDFWAKERAWVEARDAALMEALKKFTGRELEVSSSMTRGTQSKNRFKNEKEIANNAMNDRWDEAETSSLIQIITSLESEFEESGYSDENIWEEIAAKMASFGYYRSAVDFKEKWENMQMYFKMATGFNKKRREDLRTSRNNYHQPSEYYHHGHEITKERLESMELLPSNTSSYAGTEAHSSCFPFLINELGQQQLWEKEKNQHN